ncbi:hypothetical protein B0H14DRAFT_2648414 [Mycena olivaceomarginata]|nr:hypothetical protein B0H14DRAFT_2648414 [Mycena olivaceomarginata]
MKSLVSSGLPETLYDYYRRIFARFEQPLQRALVGKIFALVAFARRPLRMKELREAVGLLQSKNPRSLNQADMPFGSKLRKLLPPLIETRQDGCADPDDCTCSLFHATVLHFILDHPDVLQSGLQDPAADLAIIPDVIANACLLYLSQSRYSRLLRKRDTGKWVDAFGESIDRHHFLLYSAKYWDKGLDLITHFSMPLDTRVTSFIKSSNFETLVQVQSLWAYAQFEVFRIIGDDKRTFLRRMFPLWFTVQCVTGSDGMRLWRDFRGFQHEWKYLLACHRCQDPDCITSPYPGELDRCWWPALGPQNFLSQPRKAY